MANSCTAEKEELIIHCPFSLYSMAYSREGEFVRLANFRSTGQGVKKGERDSG
jgi:hypothetical protein